MEQENDQVEDERDEEEDRVRESRVKQTVRFGVQTTVQVNTALHCHLEAKIQKKIAYCNLVNEMPSKWFDLSFKAVHFPGSGQQGDQVNIDGGGVVDGSQGQGRLHQLLE